MQAQLLLVLFFAVFTIKASKVRPIEYDIIVEENRKSVVAKIIEVLQGREEMANVIRYLELAGRDLENKLPKFDQGIVSHNNVSEFAIQFACYYRR